MSSLAKDRDADANAYQQSSQEILKPTCSSNDLTENDLVESAKHTDRIGGSDTTESHTEDSLARSLGSLTLSSSNGVSEVEGSLQFYGKDIDPATGKSRVMKENVSGTASSAVGSDQDNDNDSSSQAPAILLTKRDIHTEKGLLPAGDFLDEPDPRLVAALHSVHDRHFILKLELDVKSFITTNSLEYFDTAPLNSYYRMLAHKIAEFYRLTHLASTEAPDCVRFVRGLSARIPKCALADIRLKELPEKPVQKTPSPAVKIMRRRSPSGNGAAGTRDQSTKPNETSNDPSKPLTREEKEAAYLLARARIFGDFKESPPDTPLPIKPPADKLSSQKEDDFQSRSHYHVVPSNSTPLRYDGVPNRFPVPPMGAGLHMAMASPYAASGGRPSPAPSQGQHNLNPVANNFHPMGNFLPSRPNGNPVPQSYHSPGQQHGYPQFYQPSALQPLYPVPQSNFVKPPVPAMSPLQHPQTNLHQLPVKPPPPQDPQSPILPMTSGFHPHYQAQQSSQMLRTHSGPHLGVTGTNQNRFPSPNIGYSSVSNGSSPVYPPQFNQMPYQHNVVGAPNFSQYQLPHQAYQNNANTGAQMGNGMSNNRMGGGVNNAWPHSLPPRPQGGLPYGEGNGVSPPPSSTYGGYGAGRGQ